MRAKSKFPLVGTMILLLAFFSAGCTTTFEEWSGNMTNERSSTHVKAFQPGELNNNGEDITVEAGRSAGVVPVLGPLRFDYHPQNRSTQTRGHQAAEVSSQHPQPANQSQGLEKHSPNHVDHSAQPKS